MFGFLSFGPFGLLSNSGRVEIRHSISIFYPEGLSVSRKFLTAPLFLSFRHVLRAAIGNRQQTCGWQGQHEQGGEGRTGKGDLNRFSTYRAKRASSDGIGYRRPALDFSSFGYVLLGQSPGLVLLLFQWYIILVSLLGLHLLSIPQRLDFVLKNKFKNNNKNLKINFKR